MEGRLELKLEKDFCIEVDTAIHESLQLTDFAKAFESLLSLEKQTRVGADAISNGRILVQIISIAYKANNLKLVNEYITILSKKHGLLKLVLSIEFNRLINRKQAITKMVQEAVTYIDKIVEMPSKLELIDILRQATDGKIYVEVERARVTRILAKIKEDQGKVIEACDILQELQVETFGSMERREKTDFILEQMRLCLAKKDFVRVQIISKKINTKFFESSENQDLKLRYFDILIQHALNEDDYFSICKYYQSIYDTPSIQQDERKRTLVSNLVSL